jgi:ABC-type branched-subunit amino acid transport system ATPase component
MAADPKLLIADEAMAGLSHSEVDDIVALLITLNERGVTIIMIEHIMRAVMSFSQRLVVLVSGKKIADGKPDRWSTTPRSWGRTLPGSPHHRQTSSPLTGRCACSRTSALEVKPGETAVLLGTNGNGKSTLMNCIMGHRAAAPGRIMAAIDGVQARSHRAHHRADRRSRDCAGAGRPPAVSRN